MGQVNFDVKKKDFYDAIILLEELGFKCKEGKKTAMCLHNKKRIAFRISMI